MTRPGKIPVQAGIEPRVCHSRGRRLNHYTNKVVSPYLLGKSDLRITWKAMSEFICNILLEAVGLYKHLNPGEVRIINQTYGFNILVYQVHCVSFRSQFQFPLRKVLMHSAPFLSRLPRVALETTLVWLNTDPFWPWRSEHWPLFSLLLFPSGDQCCDAMVCPR